MARSQMLYIGMQGAVSYPALANIEMSTGEAGTVAMWYHPGSVDQRGRVFSANTDSGESLNLFRDKEQWVWKSTTGSPRAIVTTSNTVAWRHVVATWDFSGGPGAGVLRLYLDGQEMPESPITDATAPSGIPSEISVGPGPDNTYLAAHAAFDQFGIWDSAMSAQQVAELYDRGRTRLPQEADGAGTLLLRASWDEQYDADLAQGSATATPVGEGDQYCRLDCRSRHEGKRFGYQIGIPAHDGSEDDRVPLFAVLVPEPRGSSIATNLEEYGQLEVSASGVVQAVGAKLAPWLPEPLTPMTLRAGLHIPGASVSSGQRVAVGAHDYVAGAFQEITAGSGCSTDTVVSADLTHPDGFWAGAELHVLTGALRGQKVRVADNSAADNSLTIEGAFATAPAAGDELAVIEPDRLEPRQVNGEQYRLECDLTESYSGVERFSVIETSIIRHQGYTRYNGGRIQAYPEEVTRDQVLFGKPEGVLDSWDAVLLIDRVEMDGPGTYEMTSKTADTFMVVDPATTESTKVVQAENVERELRQPQQHADPAAVQQALVAAGTWRDDVTICPRWMRYEVREDRLVALVVGVDPDGVERTGYVYGSWDETSGLVEWEDDPDPRNPFLAVEELRAVLGGRSSLYGRLLTMAGTFETGSGEWALAFTATIGHPDGMVSCAMTGAPDRYSFEPDKHFSEKLNPLTPPLAGDDKLAPEGGGIGLFGNRDCEVFFAENPWAESPGDRFWGYGRAKTVNHLGGQSFYQPGRPLSCVVTGDFKNVRHVPWRNQVIAPAFGWFHWPHPEWFHPATVGLVVDDGGVTQSDIGLWVSEDGVHLQRIFSIVERNTPPFDSGYMMPLSNPVRLGDRRLYWYRGSKSDNSEFNLASIRLDGEALYRLTDGELSGVLATSGLSREGDYWEELRINADPKDGSLTVAVVDAQTEEVLAGFGHADCDEVVDGVDERVTWNGLGLVEVTEGEIRLEFKFSRPDGTAGSPELYSWMIAAPLRGQEPQVSGVQVEGEDNPVSVASAEPKLSWTYQDPHDRDQSAYHLLVASSQAKLDANEGNLWDSGVVLSEEPEAKYAGVELGSEQTYFWKVRVRNSEGVWSEEW